MNTGTTAGPSNPPFTTTDSVPDTRKRWLLAAAGDRSAVILATLVVSLATVWLVLDYFFPAFRFVTFDARARTSVVIFFAIGQIFGAVVLLIVPFQAARERLRWVAAGFLTLGMGAIVFGYLYPSLVDAASPVVTMYGTLYVRLVATILCAIGLAAPRAPYLSIRMISLLAGVFTLAGFLLVPLAPDLPALVHLPDYLAAGSNASASLKADLQANWLFPGLTAWHFTISAIPLAASLVALWGATRRVSAQSGIGLWLVLALALLAASQLHTIFWPNLSSSLLTSSSLLRLFLVVAVIVGGVIELAVVTRQRDSLLLAEQGRTQRLEDLAQLRADFTSIVAHELANPIAAIKVMGEIVGLDDLSPDLRRRTAAEITQEARTLEMLVDDIRETARVERDDFRIAPRRIPVERLVADAAAYARRLPGTHPVTVDNAAATLAVLCDPERIGQVIRNLLNNAARYTPDGTPIAIRARPEPGQVVIEVADQGAGIPAAEIGRIFDKFTRGQGASQRNVSGHGLGLYLSRRILRLHGSDLMVESAPGEGTAFQFKLQAEP